MCHYKESEDSKIHILIQSVKIFYQQILLAPNASNFQDLVAPLKNQLGVGKWAPTYFNPWYTCSVQSFKILTTSVAEQAGLNLTGSKISEDTFPRDEAQNFDGRMSYLIEWISMTQRLTS